MRWLYPAICFHWDCTRPALMERVGGAGKLIYTSAYKHVRNLRFIVRTCCDCHFRIRKWWRGLKWRVFLRWATTGGPVKQPGRLFTAVSELTLNGSSTCSRHNGFKGLNKRNREDYTWIGPLSLKNRWLISFFSNDIFEASLFVFSELLTVRLLCPLFCIHCILVTEVHMVGGWQVHLPLSWRAGDSLRCALFPLNICPPQPEAVWYSTKHHPFFEKVNKTRTKYTFLTVLTFLFWRFISSETCTNKQPAVFDITPHWFFFYFVYATSCSSFQISYFSINIRQHSYRQLKHSKECSCYLLTQDLCCEPNTSCLFFWNG